MAADAHNEAACCTLGGTICAWKLRLKPLRFLRCACGDRSLQIALLDRGPRALGDPIAIVRDRFRPRNEMNQRSFLVVIGVVLAEEAVRGVVGGPDVEIFESERDGIAAWFASLAAFD